jgi:hypothetical protein
MDERLSGHTRALDRAPGVFTGGTEAPLLFMTSAGTIAPMEKRHQRFFWLDALVPEDLPGGLGERKKTPTLLLVGCFGSRRLAGRSWRALAPLVGTPNPARRPLPR